MNNKVSKSGDTMTGNLILNSCNLVLKNKEYRLIEAWDSKGATTTTLETYRDSDTKTRTVLFAFNPSDNSKNAQLTLCQEGNAQWATCPGSNGNNSIVTTVSHGANWVRFGNGLQICWGITGSENISTVTLPQAFKNTNYVVAGLPMQGSANTSDLYVHSKTTTQFKLQEQVQKAEQRNWIAIGYWN